jgi:hypothetical protein
MQRRRIYHMVWLVVNGGRWYDQDGKPFAKHWWPAKGLPRSIRIQLGAAHVDPAGAFLDPENVRVWCTWCHLHHDQPQHRDTRAGRRDRLRPLLQEHTHVA